MLNACMFYDATEVPTARAVLPSSCLGSSRHSLGTGSEEAQFDSAKTEMRGRGEIGVFDQKMAKEGHRGQHCVVVTVTAVPDCDTRG